MDPVSTLMTVCKVACWVTQWIATTKEKDQTIQEIASTVSRIYDILSPFQAPAIAAKLDHNLLGAVRGIGEALNRTKDHLVAWQERRIERVTALFLPSAVTSDLRNDERLLTNQLIIALFSMTASNYFHGTHTLDNEMGSLVLGSVGNQDVKLFWRDYVGAKVAFVPNDRFPNIIKLWFRDTFGEDLSDSVCKTLMFRIDEFAIGGITPTSLERFATGIGLKDRILQLRARRNNISQVSAPSIKQNSSHLQLPLIIWVDDNRENNTRYVSFARSRGVTVIELPSTALAKAWVDENLDFLHQNDSPNRIRVISDNARFESDPQVGTFLNLSAGESILRYLRGELLNLPVLIFCGRSLRQTNYVLSFEMTGSTTSVAVCMKYISALADGIENDREWKAFCA